MAYTAIPDTDIAVGKPGSNNLFTLLRDNPIAIANGDSGAPRIQTAGINDSAVTTIKIGPLAVSNAKIANSTIDFANKIANSSVTGSWSIGAGASQLIPKGVYHVIGASSIWRMQIYEPTNGWQNLYSISAASAWQVISDGVNVRVVNISAGSATVYYKRII